MDTVSEICNYLRQKKTLFEQYEENTTPMLDCEDEAIEKYITKRSQLAIEIDKITAEINKLCEEDAQAELLRDALSNRCSYGELSDRMRGVFELAQEIYAVVHRISMHEPQILMRMETLRAEYKKLIETSHNTPKIVRYLHGMGTQPENGSLLSQRYDKA